jgi:hypothetical protein
MTNISSIILLTHSWQVFFIRLSSSRVQLFPTIIFKMEEDHHKYIAEIPVSVLTQKFEDDYSPTVTKILSTNYTHIVEQFTLFFYKVNLYQKFEKIWNFIRRYEYICSIFLFPDYFAPEFLRHPTRLIELMTLN